MEVGGRMLRSHNLAYSSTDRQHIENDIYTENNIYTEISKFRGSPSHGIYS